MLHIKKYILSMLAFCLIGCMSMTAFAHEVPDLNRKGSITIVMQDDGAAIPGGLVTLYRVGEVYVEDGNYSFVLTGDFKESGIKIENINTAQKAQEFAGYAMLHSVSGQQKQVEWDGKVCFTDLELGLYLIIQNEAPIGYERIQPFLITVPMRENGSHIYDVIASPKTELTMKTLPETSKTVTTPPTVTRNFTYDSSVLPQTGQLNWPIPVLVIAGLILFSVGWELRFGKLARNYEERRNEE